MALQLKQIYKSPLASYIFLGLVGGLSTLAFSPFNIKLIIPFTLATLIYSTVDSRNIIDACKRTFSWGLGYWMCGTGWLIVSIHYYGNTDIIISSIIILLMGMLLSAVFITPFALVRFIQFNQNIFFKSLAIASILIILEFSRFLLLGGFPWLLPGLVFIDTLGQTTIPIFGVYGASYIIYFFSSLIAFSVLEKRKNFLFLGVSFLLIFIPYQTNQKYESYQGLNLSIIQPSLDPFKKYTAGSDVAIEDTLLDLTNKSNDADLIIWPESPLPYLNSDPRMTRLISKLGEEQTILSGSWQYRNNKLHNSMTILGSDQTYLKRHLVPFGEYVPFEGILRGLIEFFDMPMSSLSAGSANQDLLQFRNFKFLGLICFDIAFPLSYLKEVRKSDFIVNISNDTWFGSSYGPYQHLQIVRARALEANKWIARGTSDGISTIVDNNGTIVSILEKGTRGSLVGSIQKTSKTSFFYTFGYLISPILSIIMLMTILILKLRK